MKPSLLLKEIRMADTNAMSCTAMVYVAGLIFRPPCTKYVGLVINKFV